MTVRQLDTLDLVILRELAGRATRATDHALSPPELDALGAVRSTTTADLILERPGFVGTLLAPWTAAVAHEVGQGWQTECLVHTCRQLWARLDDLLATRSWAGSFDCSRSARAILLDGFLFPDGSFVANLVVPGVFDRVPPDPMPPF